MSFEHSARLESQPTTFRRQDDPQYRDDPEFHQFTTELSEKLITLQSKISRLNSDVAALGTKKENARVRERVQDLLDETSSGFRDIHEGLKKVQEWPDLNPSQKYTQSKLNREAKATLDEFQALQRAALEKQRASASAARVALDEQSSPEQAYGGQQQQQTQQQQEQEQLRLASQDEVDFQEQLIIERESEIRNIEQSVGELNELFRDVAHMVHEQGEQLDIISVNVQNTRDDTRGASTELRTAERHQRSARGKACCLLLIVAVVVVIVVLAVVIN
ncbi:MAG: hypothetical protein M1820_009779 [Bogoriella megaspora]|nr:MAG: hypothetical protein M1820_009779 [Bogoriella megaspora]